MIIKLRIDSEFRPPGSIDGKESACSAGDPGSILGWEYPQEKGMATHYCILAWRIPWTEEPGGPQSVGSQRVGHDGAAFASRSLHHLLLSTVGSELSVGRASGPRGLLSV